ncbi:MAG: hypothetical protein LBL15_05865, partial [Oscillospiraceae bacterium]|nr:hypothetical protein [Oscillospiraceae bacterium]
MSKTSKHIRKGLSLLLTFAMLAALMPAIASPALAAEPGADNLSSVSESTFADWGLSTDTTEVTNQIKNGSAPTQETPFSLGTIPELAVRTSLSQYSIYDFTDSAPQ